MPPLRDAIRYPAKRVLLQRTRLAYVHLRNLLTDAKRDRAARVSGYVAVWMPEELLVLFLEEGEVVNATSSTDGIAFHTIAISDAIGRVPTAAEYGSICFHEASNEQLDLMYASQTGTAIAFPRELKAHDPTALLAYLDGLMVDGALEIIADGAVNYASLAGGRPTSGCFVDPRASEVTGHIRLLLEGKTLAVPPLVRLWPVPDPLPAQASPALIQSYRELMTALALRLVALGKSGAPEIVEGARRSLVARHPMLERFTPAVDKAKDPVTNSAALTKAIAAWIGDVLWAAGVEDPTPEDILKELTASRRHVFQAAGLYESLPWKVQW